MFNSSRYISTFYRVTNKGHHDPDLITLFVLPVTRNRWGSQRWLIDRLDDRSIGIILRFFESIGSKRRYWRTKDATSCYATPRIRRMQRGRPTRLMHRLAHVTMITSRATSTRCCFQHHGHGTRRIFPRAECSSIDLFFFSSLFFPSKKKKERKKFLKVFFFLFYSNKRRNREEKVWMIARNKGKANDSNGNNRREKKKYCT